jgi:hypothetical protein
MKKLFILFLLILGCTSDEKFNDDVIHQTGYSVDVDPGTGDSDPLDEVLVLKNQMT